VVSRRFSGGKDVGASEQHSPHFAPVIDPLGEGYWERIRSRAAIFLYGGLLANTASPHATLVRKANTVRRVAFRNLHELAALRAGWIRGHRI
jgi:hypothetical protein